MSAFKRVRSFVRAQQNARSLFFKFLFETFDHVAMEESSINRKQQKGKRQPQEFETTSLFLNRYRGPVSPVPLEKQQRKQQT
jgi:hypothetical protein